MIPPTSPTPKDALDFLERGGELPDGEVPVDLRAAAAPTLDGPPLGDVQSAVRSNGNGTAKTSKPGSWRAKLTTTRGKGEGPDGKPVRVTRATPHNVAVILTHHAAWLGVLAFDERQVAPVFLRAPPFADYYAAQGTAPYPRRVTDSDLTRFRSWLETEEHLGVRAEEVRAGVLMGAQRSCFDPVRDYLDGVAWDGVARLDTWPVTYLGAADSPLVRAMGARWFIGACARVREPGCKVDTALVLEGAQGAGKSKALAALVPDVTFFTDDLADLRTKEAAMGLAGKWIVEVPELAALERSVEVVKAFLSRSVDRFRAPYAASTEDHDRRCIFAGTTNAEAYLRDETGARRFWPIKVHGVRVAELARDRDQLWAEADARYRAGEKWWLHEGGLVADATDEQDARYVGDEWQGLAAEWLNAPLQATTDEFTIAEILKGAIQLEHARLGPGEQVRAGKVMRRLGWVQRQRRRNGVPVRFYERPSRVSRVEGDERGNP